VSNLDDLDRVATAIRDHGAGLDTPFANAGGGEFAALGDITWQHCADTFNSNVGGTGPAGLAPDPEAAEQLLKGLAAGGPMNRLGRPEEIADAVNSSPRGPAVS
jgi:NAD(P)-dependent dehydrogenase (short-subunit alcohol dehydrogenase family)